ncbi:hypothetical protein [Longimicrobium sp.]|uniref:hypothetical protein n=1 Tax=Longimicrobium sp. TaxID=2029185 RepID=UPI003B3BD7A1
MKIHARYFVAAILAAAPVTAVAQTAPPAAEQREHAREGRRGEMRGPREGRGGPGRSPVQRLLRQREQLGLTAQQVSRLEAIDRDLQARNAPLVQQLTALRPDRGQGADGARARGERRARPDSAARAERRQRGERPQLTAEQRQQMEQRRAQAQPIMQQLRANGEQALTQARAVLTAEQQQKIQQRMDERRERQGDRPGRGERGGRPRGGGTQPR